MTEKNSPINVIVHPVSGECENGGLSKREYFAAKAMQGLMTTLIPTADNQLCPNYENVKYMADLAVSAADALIDALNTFSLPTQ